MTTTSTVRQFHLCVRIYILILYLQIVKLRQYFTRNWKKVTEMVLSGRPPDGTIYGGTSYGGRYINHYENQFGDQYQYKPTEPYTSYSVQSWTLSDESYIKYHHENNFGAHRRRETDIGRTELGGNPIKVSNRGGTLLTIPNSKMEKETVLSYLKLQFKSCEAHLKNLVNQVGYWNIASVKEVELHCWKQTFKQI